MKTAVIVSTLFVAIGLLKLPYSFYMLLRVALFVTAAIGVARAREERHSGWLWLYAIFAILYNPFLPVRLGDKSLWVLLNVVTIVLYWVGLFRFGKHLPGVRKP